MRRVTGILICSALLCGPAGHGKCERWKKGKPDYLWEAVDSAWAVVGVGRLEPGWAEEVMRRKPVEVEGLKAVET